ncbi:MAG TPA: EscU/YscU/HrcU family type III secretion system export apparatus switch protein [Pirellulales bacterium]|jgi:flagellar biosynthetic protein FlhB|nr:EscU/YscU/HrcU family type III secretion system export apparatus switch protein [Pirellulales bacterium]
MPERDDEATIEATPHRRELARQQGHAAKSAQLTGALAVAGGLALILWFGGSMATFLGALAAEQLGGKAWLTADAALMTERADAALAELAKTVLPMLALLAALAIVANVGQTGVQILPQRLLPDWRRVDPLEGLPRIFSPASAGRAAASMVKLMLLVGAAYWLAVNELPAMMGLVDQPLPQIAEYLTSHLLMALLKLGCALVAVGAVDYALQWWQRERDLRMTPRELRDEMKNQQPKIAAASRRRQAQSASSLAIGRTEPIAHQTS